MLLVRSTRRAWGVPAICAAIFNRRSKGTPKALGTFVDPDVLR